jgi:hypothetical protein
MSKIVRMNIGMKTNVAPKINHPSIDGSPNKFSNRGIITWVAIYMSNANPRKVMVVNNCECKLSVG